MMSESIANTPGILACLGNPQAKPLSISTSEGQHCVLSGHQLHAFNGVAEHNPEGLLTAISGNYYWKARELADHSVRHGKHATLAFAYQQYGKELLEQLAGRFALAIWDSHNQEGLIATDRFSQIPVYWHHDGTQMFCAPRADQLVEIAQLERALDPQALYHYLFFHMVPAPGTIYQKVQKLPPAHALSIKNNVAEPYCYWVPDFSPPTHETTTHAGDEMLQLLSSAIAQFDTGEKTGAFLSGGLDSSSVAGLLRKTRGSAADTFSIGFDADGYDEIAYARIANQHFGNQGHEYYVTPEDVLDALPKVAAAYDEPFGNSSAIPAYFCAREAKQHGIARLLAGDGGDELFAGNERYAKQQVFEAYLWVPELIRHWLIEPLANVLPQKSLFGKVRSYIEQAKVPLPARLHSYNFLARFSAEKMFNETFLASVDTRMPYQLQEEIYHRPKRADRLNRMLYLDWYHTLASNDLCKVNRMCQLAGMEVEYPMLDDMVVDFSTRIPSGKKMSYNRLRHFYKHAVRHLLPDAIINKSKHGFGLPFGVWMSNHQGLQQLAADNLQRFRERKILRPEFIDELIELHRKSHAGYYGELVWILVMLELWLDTHEIKT